MPTTNEQPKCEHRFVVISTMFDGDAVRFISLHCRDCLEALDSQTAGFSVEVQGNVVSVHQNG